MYQNRAFSGVNAIFCEVQLLLCIRILRKACSTFTILTPSKCMPSCVPGPATILTSFSNMTIMAHIYTFIWIWIPGLCANAQRFDLLNFWCFRIWLWALSVFKQIDRHRQNVQFSIYTTSTQVCARPARFWKVVYCNRYKLSPNIWPPW